MDFNERLAERQKGAALLASPAKSFASTVLDKLWKRVTRGGNLVDLGRRDPPSAADNGKETALCGGVFQPSLYGQGGNQTPQAITAMEGLQDQLGSLNDLATAPDMLSKLALSGVPGAGDLVSAADKGTLLNATAEADVPLLTRSASGAEAGENSCRGRIWIISSFGSCDHPAAAMRSETIPNEAPHRIRYGAEELQRHLGGG